MSIFGSRMSGFFGGAGGGTPPPTELVGAGIENYVAKWNGIKSLTISQIFDNGTYVAVGTTNIGTGVTTTSNFGTNKEIYANGGFNVNNVGDTSYVKTGMYNGTGNYLDFYSGNSKISEILYVGGGLGNSFLIQDSYNSGVATGLVNALSIKGSVGGITLANNVEYNQINISPTYSQLSPLNVPLGTGTIRGIYYNPNVGNINTSQHIAFQNTKGDNYFNSTSGKTLIGHQSTFTAVYSLEILNTDTPYAQYVRFSNELNTNKNAIIFEKSTSPAISLHDSNAKRKLLIGNGGGVRADFITYNDNYFYFSYSDSLGGALLPSELLRFTPTINYTSGTNTHTILNIFPDFRITGGTNTLRGVYYNPNKTLATNPTTEIAWENTQGDIIFGNLKGTGTRLVVADSNGKLGTTTTPYGFFFDDTTQNSTPINTAIKILISKSQSSTTNVTLSDSKISVTEAGVYNIIVTFQFENTSGGTHSASSWLQKGNGAGASSIIDNSNFEWQLGSGQHMVGVLNNALSLQANDYIECYFSTTNAGITIVATGTQVSPTRPATPSVTFEINRIS